MRMCATKYRQPLVIQQVQQQDANRRFVYILVAKKFHNVNTLSAFMFTSENMCSYNSTIVVEVVRRI